MLIQPRPKRARQTEDLPKRVRLPIYKPETVRQSLPGRFAYLTNQEVRVVKLIAVGWDTKEIATALELSVKTVDAHRYNLKLKLGISKSILLAHAAIAARMVDPIEPVWMELDRGAQGAD